MVTKNRESTSEATQIKRLELELEHEKQSVQDLEGEVIAVIQGTSAFGSMLIIGSKNRSSMGGLA